MRLALLVALTVALSASPAHAVTRDQITPDWEQRARTAAVAYWGAAPACGVPTIDYSWSNGRQNGGWIVGDCAIGVDPSMLGGWPWYCALIAHEYGHLLNHVHEPGTVMDADVLHPELIPGCRTRSGPVDRVTLLADHPGRQRRLLKHRVHLVQVVAHRHRR